LRTPKGMSGPTIHIPVSWSPDSKRLAFGFLKAPAKVPPGYWREKIEDAVAGRIKEPLSSFQLWLGTAETGRTKKLLGSDMAIWQFPRFSRDGKKLLAYDASRSNIALIEVSSGEHRFLMPAISHNLAGVNRAGFDWDRSGSAAYVSVGYHLEKKTEQSGIWRVNLKNNSRKRLSTGVGAYTLSVSPSGQWLAYTICVRNQETQNVSWIIHIASLPDFKVRTISKRGTDRFVAWPKQKDRLAFCEKGQIAVWSPSTNKIVRIPVPEGQPESLSWIGSTDAIAYSIDHREIWILDVTSGKHNRLLSASDYVENKRNTKEKESLPEKADRTLDDQTKNDRP